MNNCIVCGKPAAQCIDGGMLCEQHRDEFLETKAAGKPLDLPTWAVKARREKTILTSMRFTEAALAKAGRIAKVRRVSRNRAIQDLILEAAEGQQ